MKIKAQAMALAGAASIMSGHAAAQEQTPVAVAVVDAGVTRLDFQDPNVRFVQVNSDAQRSFHGNQVNLGEGYTHGDAVASSFVREYRKIEPNRPIVIYAVNPYRETPKGLAISTKAIVDAMDQLKAANVKIAVTAFGLKSEQSAELFMKPFRESGIAVFAAVPNDPSDGGLFPARSKGAISVAVEDRGGYMDANYGSRTWVDFAIQGHHHAKAISTRGRGTSYATAHAAAYGVYVTDRNPSLTVEGIRDAIAEFGERPKGDFRGEPMRTTRIGSDHMIKDMTARLGSQPVRMAVAPAIETPAVSSKPVLRAASFMQAAGGMQR